MRRIALAVAVALAAACSVGQDLKWVEISSTNDVEALKSIPEWRHGVDTNGITITVCVGAAVIKTSRLHHLVKYPLSRDLVFDSDGRLVRVSPVSIIPGMSERSLPRDTNLDRLVLDLDREKEFEARRLEIERNRSPEENARMKEAASRLEEAIRQRHQRRGPRAP